MPKVQDEMQLCAAKIGRRTGHKLSNAEQLVDRLERDGYQVLLQRLQARLGELSAGELEMKF